MNDKMIELAARVLSGAWRNMHTNEALGFQIMLARALDDAGLLKDEDQYWEPDLHE
jgi:hypothetical protein